MPSSMSDPGLRAFLKAANETEADCLEQYPALIDYIDKIDDLFRKLIAVEIQGDIFTATLFLNAHASFLAAARLAVSGQAPPTFMTLRGALESALYGLVASQNDENKDVWLNRAKNLHRSRKLYTARNALKILEIDPGLQAAAAEAYELAIEFGAHPNARSVIAHLRLDEANRRLTLAYLQSVPSAEGMRTIIACIETGLVIIQICPHAFPDHEPAFAIHAEATNIRREFNAYLRDNGYLQEQEQEPITDGGD
jgi:hypothetical protein